MSPRTSCNHGDPSPWAKGPSLPPGPASFRAVGPHTGPTWLPKGGESAVPGSDSTLLCTDWDLSVEVPLEGRQRGGAESARGTASKKHSGYRACAPAVGREREQQQEGKQPLQERREGGLLGNRRSGSSLRGRRSFGRSQERRPKNVFYNFEGVSGNFF